ncbi:hypothetical protein PM03_06695 [Thalassobacter stenotrophicus]|uniref:hypothetical protein n=1 Tax=Thalassobacter TaxID=266808 RepID=UPI00051CCCB0|nr:MULTISPECIES: hypothetical protein [Thalassobacter]KGK80345.1 hypothetical protein PM03_06695 [Thalassobacter stenotrophicus]KGL01298.1 hypothetical protein PM04_09930 [Thalassobacter sp. 16PALIMAR09]
MGKHAPNAPIRPVRGETILFFIAAIGVFALNMMLWGYDTPPLIDWPNHMARHVLQCGAAGAEHVARYYAFALDIVPNLTSDLIHTWPGACADLEVTQKVLIQVGSFGLFAATAVLHRTIWAAWSVWPLIAVMVMHNMTWAFGFENFVLAAPAAILVLALWFAMAARGAVVRLAVIWPCAVLVYVMHLYAFGFIMLMIGLLELHDVTRAPSTRAAILRRAGMVMAVAFIPAVHLVGALRASPELEAGGIDYGTPIQFLTAFVAPFASFGLFASTAETIVVGLLGLAVTAAIILWVRRAGLQMSLDPRVRFALPALALITLLVPYYFSGIAYTNMRFPVLLAPVVLAAIRVDFTPRALWVFAGAMLVLLAGKILWLTDKWALHDAQVAELRAAAAVLSPQDRLLVTRHEQSQTIRLHSHSAAYILRDRGPYWTGVFTGGNAIAPLPAYAPRDKTHLFPIPWQVLMPVHQDHEVFEAGSYLADWRDFYTHTLVLFAPDGAARAQAAGLHNLGAPLASGSFFEILEFHPVAP